MIARLHIQVRSAWVALRARRTLWMALGAVGFGALAMVGARNYIGERLELEKARLQPPQAMVEVVVAKRELVPGETVGPDTMAVRSVPRDLAPGGAVSPARFDTVLGTRLLVSMQPGEPLLASGVASPESGGISSRVRPGVRAMTIAVDEVNSLSGMLQPGDRIDLMLSVRPPSADGVPQSEVTRTVMQGVIVMATGRQSRPGPDADPLSGRPYTSITVEVEPEQAQRLVVAQRSGKLTAVLRNPQDRSQVAERKLDLNALLGSPAPLAAAPRPAPQVIVGGRGPLAETDRAPAAYPSPAATPSPAGPGTAGADPGMTGGQGAHAPPLPGIVPPAPGGPAGVWVPLDPPQTVPLLR
jgi:pilus assembly protein CpaB